MSPRPAFLSASDYAFYLRKQVEKEKDDAHYESKENAYPGSSVGIAIESPKLSELLRKLDEDLRVASGSFVEDFAEEPNNGIFWLLDLLRISLNKQQCPGIVMNNKEESNNKMIRNRDRQHQFKRAMTDEYDCLLCLRHASSRSKKILYKIVSHRNGLTSIASCIVSNLTKSRLIALELLTNVCGFEDEGGKKVLEAMSTMRLIFGESVRFKLIVAILNAGSSSVTGIESSVLTFINTLLSKCTNVAERVRLQCELEEAGLNIQLLEKKIREKNIPPDDIIWSELKQYNSTFVNVVELIKENRCLNRENLNLNEEMEMLRRAVTKLEEDKINLMQIERELKEKCEDLQQEITSLRSGASSVQIQPQSKKGRFSARPGSDNSDPMSVTADSGRWSDSDGCDAVASPRSVSNETRIAKDSYTDDQNVRNEDIFIYIPSIRPPLGFNYSEEHIPQPVEPKCVKKQNGNKSNNYESRWKLRQRSCSDIDNKPTVVDVYPKQSRNDFSQELSCSSSLLGKDREENELTLDWQYPKKDDSSSLGDSSRNDLLIPVNCNFKKFSNSMNQLTELQNDTEFQVRSEIRSSELKGEFFLKSRGTSSTSLNNSNGELNRTKHYQKVSHNSNSKSRNFASSLQSYFFSGSIHKSKNGHNSNNSDKSENPKSFPLPNAYKKSFINRGHKNCGLYSGFSLYKKGSKEIFNEFGNEDTTHVKDVGSWF